MNAFIIGFMSIFGGIILGFVISPLCVLFNPLYSSVLNGISLVLFTIGLLFGGKFSYDYFTSSLKSNFKFKRK